jgi:hypothetical protein
MCCILGANFITGFGRIFMDVFQYVNQNGKSFFSGKMRFEEYRSEGYDDYLWSQARERQMMNRLDGVCIRIEMERILNPPKKGESMWWWLDRVGLAGYFEGK